MDLLDDPRIPFITRILMLHTHYGRLKENGEPLYPRILDFISELRTAQRKGVEWHEGIWLQLTAETSPGRPAQQIVSHQLWEFFKRGIAINTPKRRKAVFAALKHLLDADSELRKEFESVCELYFTMKEGRASGEKVAVAVHHET